MSRGGCILFITRLLLLCLVDAEEGIISVNIQPVVALLFQGLNAGNGRRLDTITRLDQNILHPHVRAVYTSVIELDDTNSTGYRSDLSHIKENNMQLKKFNEKRYLSKYERYHKERQRRLQAIPQNHTTKSGFYEEFQSAPLAQGYGTHYVSLWVGYPTPQKQTLIVDTGSHHTAFPCKGCNRCGEKYHTDKSFDMDQSISFHPLSCNQCRWGAECKTIPVLSELDMFRTKSKKKHRKKIETKTGCYLETSYTEGSRWEAFQVSDRVFLGGTDAFSAADPEAERFSFNFIFGCQTFSYGLFVRQLANGIMGLSQHEATLPRIMYNQGKVSSRIFGICFRTEISASKKGISAGILTLGGVDKRLQSTPMVYAKNMSQSGWFTVYIKKIYLRIGGGQSAMVDKDDKIIEVPSDAYSINSGKGVILDSGTTDTYFHQSLAEPFNKVWREVTGTYYSNSPIRLTQNQLIDLPTILVQLLPYSTKFDMELESPDDVIGLVGTNLDSTAPTDILIAIPASHYMEYTPSKDLYTPRIYFSESHGGVLGANALQGHDISFDWENGRIGISESTCKLFDLSTTTNNVFSEGLENNQGQDCAYQKSVITTHCIESVDSSVCTPENPNSVFDGIETLTMIIDHPVSSTRVPCEEVIRREHGFLDGRCSESGTCSFRKKCQISCKNVIASITEVGGKIVYDNEDMGNTKYFNMTNRSHGDYIPYFLIAILCYLTYLFRRKKLFAAIARKKDSKNTKGMDHYDTFEMQSYDIEKSMTEMYKPSAKCIKRFK
jgi:hypothetical protein